MLVSPLEMLATENDYHSRGLIAVAVCDDPWYRVMRSERLPGGGWTFISETWASTFAPKGVSTAAPDARHLRSCPL
jgi:hypothetical protein